MDRSSTFELGHTRQCRTCPWKSETTVDDIPNYDPELHDSLSETIAKGADIFSTTNVMGCHYAREDEERHCIGWLSHQLGPGNNLGLRIQMLRCENIGQIELDGPQVEGFQDTFS